MEYDQEYPDTVSRREVTKLKIDFRQAMKSFLKSMRSAKKLKKASKHREVNRCMTEFYKLVNLFGVESRFTMPMVFDTIFRTFEEEVVPFLNSGEYLRPDLWVQMSWIHDTHLCTEKYATLDRPSNVIECRKKALIKLVRWFKTVDATEEYNFEEIMKYFTERIERMTSYLDVKFEHDICIKCIQIIQERPCFLRLLEDFYIWAGHMSMLAGNYEEAYSELKQGLRYAKEEHERNPQHGVQRFFYFSLGKCYKAKKKEKLAEKQFLRYIEKSNDSLLFFSFAHMELGNIYYDRFDVEKAITEYTKAFSPIVQSGLKDAMNPEDEDENNLGKDLSGNVRAAVVNPFRPEYQECKRRLVQYWNDRPSNVALTFEEREKLAELSTFVESFSLIKSEEDILPNLTWNDEDEAMEILNFYEFEICEIWQILYLRGKYRANKITNLYEYRGWAYASLGCTYESFFDLLTSRMDNKYVEPICQYVVDIGFELKLFDETLDYLYHTIKGHEIVYNKLGGARGARGAHPHVRHVKDRITNLYFKVIECQIELKNFSIAIAVLNSIRHEMKNAEGKAKCYYFYGLCYGQLGQHDQALYYFDKSIDLNTDFNRGCLQKGRSLIMAKRYQEAFESVLMGPNTIEALILLTLSAEILGKPYKMFIRKIFKIRGTLAPLKLAIDICPSNFRPGFLDTLVIESYRAEKYVLFRNSCSIVNFFRDNSETYKCM